LLFLRDKKQKETQKKFYAGRIWEVAEAGWTLQFKTGPILLGGGDVKYFFLRIGKKGKN